MPRPSLDELFDAAQDVPAERRAAWLDVVCADDAELRRELTRLLVADAREQGVLESGPALLADAMADATDIPQGFGSWRVLRRLGAGGMGEVWLAERDDAGFVQRAAIKQVAWPTPGLLQRFQRERQILARLEHPGVARLIDGGVGAAGCPYLAMEYVEGERIDTWVRARALDVRATVRLLLQVCEAVQFAHRNLVVHSDIKPSNILMTDEGTPRLLDFGIARVLSGDDAEATRTTTRLMTPDYAAPEWIEGGPVTTAVDMYALGVLAYELLSGTKPYCLARGSDLARQIGGRPAQPPSAALARGAPDWRARRRALHGDLDRIVQTAMARDPARRYSSVEAFARDLRHWLDGRPVAARGDDAWYRLRKFIARNRVAVAAVALVLVVLMAATAFSLRAAHVARAQTARAETVTGFLTDMFRIADPKGTPGGVHMTALQMLDAGARNYDHELAGQPALTAKLATTLATIYSELGQYDRAIALASDALAQPGIDDDARAASLAVMARAQYEKGDYDAAQSSVDRARQLDAAIHGEHSAPVARDIALAGEIARRQGHFKRAEVLTSQALALSRATLKRPNAQIAAELNQLAVLYGDMRRVKDAREPTEQALAMFRALYGEDHIDVAENTVNLGAIDMQTGKVSEALTLFNQAEAIYHRLLPGDHPALANTLTNHARALDRSGRFKEARAKYHEALAMQRRLLGDQHPDVATTLNNLAVLELEVGDAAQAAGHFREVLGIWAAQGNPAHPLAQISRIHLGSALRELGKLDESVTSLEASCALAHKTFGDNHPIALLAGIQLGVSLRRDGKLGQALRVEGEVDRAISGAHALPPLFRAKANVQYALTELEAGDKDAARRRIAQAGKTMTGLRTVNPVARGQLLLAQARIAFAGDDQDKGCGLVAQAVTLSSKAFGDDNIHTTRARDLGKTCVGP